MLKEFFNRTKNSDPRHMSSVQLRNRAAAILKSTQGLDGLRDVNELLAIVQERYRKADNVRPIAERA